MSTKNPHAVDKWVGARIRAARLLAGVSQEVLGKHCGLTFQQIHKYEKGANRVGASRMTQIAQCLKQPVSFFFPEDDRIASPDDPVLKMSQLPEGVAFARDFCALLPDTRRVMADIVHILAAEEKR